MTLINKIFRKTKQTLMLALTLLWLIACGNPVQLTMDGGAFEADLASTVQEEKRQAPKYKTKKPLIRRPISDVVTTDTAQVSPPPPADPPSEPPQAETEPEYVQTLAKKTTKPTSAKYRNIADTQTIELPAETTPIPTPFTGGEGKVDIVFIVDVSHSMNHFLRSSQIRQVFSGFTSALSPLDWQMMFTNADYGDRWFLANLGARNGKAMPLEHNGQRLKSKFLNKQTPHYSSVFIDTLRRHDFFEYTEDVGDSTQEVAQCQLAPGCQSMTFNEQPLKVAKSAWTKNRSFFRPGADVALIIFSDSDEGEKHKKDSKRTKAKEVIEAFEKQWGQEGKRLVAYGIIMVPGEDQECVDKYSREGLFGTELARMAELTNGTNYSLCAKSHVPLAQQMVDDFQEQ